MVFYKRHNVLTEAVQQILFSEQHSKEAGSLHSKRQHC